MADYTTQSNKIAVFPNARRAVDDTYLSARKMTEENIVGIIKHITDQPSYVITEQYDSTKPFEFVIGGYYFSINPSDTVFSIVVNGLSQDGRDFLTAEISVDNTTDYAELVGQDTEVGGVSLYNGVEWGTTIFPSGSPITIVNTDTKLYLLGKNSSGYFIPNESRIKFKPDRLSIADISYIGGITVS